MKSDFLNIEDEETYTRYNTVKDEREKKYRLGGIDFANKRLQIFIGIDGDTAKFETAPWDKYKFFCQCCQLWYPFSELEQSIYPQFLYCKTSHKNMMDILYEQL